MTKEQEEAIEYFKKHIKYFEEQIRFIEAIDCDYYDEELELYQNRVKQFNTILSILNEKDKMINLMADYLTTPIHGKEWVKKYFEDKVKEEKNNEGLCKKKMCEI